jgi:hypothetical protein
MDTVRQNTRSLWDRYLATRSNEYRTALVERYMPMVQMQTALWVYGLQACRAANPGEAPSDGLAEAAAGTLFLPFVPPASTGTRVTPAN